jgi:hypothetical protein
MTKEEIQLTARERKIAITLLICFFGSFGLIRVIFDAGARWHIVNAPKNLNWHISRLNLNPFQKNISKSVYVFEYANDPVMGKYGVVYLEPKCLDQTKSIRKKEFDELLSKGVKITSSIPRKTEVTVGNLYGECVGASYILEGPENLLNKL